jgi:hypothetical protein
MVCKVFGGEYRPGTRDGFHRLVVERSLPMLERRKIAVLGYGASLQEDSSYYLIRGYPSLEERQRQEDAFYGRIRSGMSGSLPRILCVSRAMGMWLGGRNI